MNPFIILIILFTTAMTTIAICYYISAVRAIRASLPPPPLRPRQSVFVHSPHPCPVHSSPPVLCAWCRRIIRPGQAGLPVSHGICPDCRDIYFPSITKTLTK